MSIDIIQVILAILLITAILMQSKGSGLGAAFGGGGSVKHVKRGAEKGLHIITIVIAVLFLLTALFNTFN